MTCPFRKKFAPMGRHNAPFKPFTNPVFLLKRNQNLQSFSVNAERLKLAKRPLLYEKKVSKDILDCPLLCGGWTRSIFITLDRISHYLRSFPPIFLPLSPLPPFLLFSWTSSSLGHHFSFYSPSPSGHPPFLPHRAYP